MKKNIVLFKLLFFSFGTATYAMEMVEVNQVTKEKKRTQASYDDNSARNLKRKCNNDNLPYVNIRDVNGDTLLHRAVIEDNDGLVEYLIKNKADLNIKNNIKKTTPLSTACAIGNEKIVALLLQHKADCNAKDCHSPVLLAIGKKNMPILKQLISSGVDYDQVYQEAPLLHYIMSKIGPKKKFYKKAFFELLKDSKVADYKDRKGDTLLHLACKLGFFDIVSKLLGKVEIDIKNNQGDTPLLCACQKGFHSIVFKLLVDGANPKIVNNKGYTALQIAVEDNNKDIVNYLLSWKADPNAISLTGKKLLQLAIENDNQYAVARLLEYGAHQNEPWNSANSALLFILDRFHEKNNMTISDLTQLKETVVLLIKHGANCLILDKSMQSVIDYVRKIKIKTNLNDTKLSNRLALTHDVENILNHELIQQQREQDSIQKIALSKQAVIVKQQEVKI